MTALQSLVDTLYHPHDECCYFCGHLQLQELMLEF